MPTRCWRGSAWLHISRRCSTSSPPNSNQSRRRRPTRNSWRGTASIPLTSAMFEDLARNLVVPHQLGMTTVLVVPDGSKRSGARGLGAGRPRRRPCRSCHRRSDRVFAGAELSTTSFCRRPCAERSQRRTAARSLDSPLPNPDKSLSIATAIVGFPKEISMSLASLESTLNAAFEARDGISTATKGEVRDAVDHALELLDKGEARVAEREASGKWKVQSMAEEGGAAVVPPQRHGRDCRRPRQRGVVGQGALEIRQAGAKTAFATPAFAPCRARSCAARPSSPATSC